MLAFIDRTKSMDLNLHIYKYILTVMLQYDVTCLLQTQTRFGTE